MRFSPMVYIYGASSMEVAIKLLAPNIKKTDSRRARLIGGRGRIRTYVASNLASIPSTHRNYGPAPLTTRALSPCFGTG